MASTVQNIEIFNDYEGKWSPWRARAKKMHNFYHSRQFSSLARKKLRKMGLKPIVINLIRPLLRQQQAILTSTRPTWKVVPVSGGSKEVADMAQKFLVGKWNSDYVDLVYADVTLDQLTSGLGWLYVDIANFLDNETFDIQVSRMNWKYVYPDPMASKFDFSDAENILIKKVVGANRAAVIYGLSKAQIAEATTTSTIDASDINKPIDVIDRFSKYPVTRVEWDVNEWIDDDKDKGRVEISDELPPRVFYTSKLTSKIEKEQREYVNGLKTLQSEGKIKLRLLKDLNVYRNISVGNLDIYKGVMNIRDYPLIAFTGEFTDEATGIDGEAIHLEGIQEAYNKYYMLVMQNALLSGNNTWDAPEGSINNKSQWQLNGSIAGAVREWKPNPSLTDGGRPRQVQGAPISAAFYGLAQDLMEKAKYEASVYSPMLGDPNKTPDTFSTTASLQDFGSQAIKLIARRNDIQLAKAGEVVLQFMQQYTGHDELLSFVDDQAFDASGKANPRFGETVEIGRLNSPTVDPERLVGQLQNDASIGKYSLKVLTQPNLGSDRLNKAAMLTSMVMNKALPLTPAVAKILFDFMEIPGYMEIIQEITAQSGSDSKIQELVKNIQVLQKQNTMLQNEAMKLSKKLEISDFRNHLDHELLKIKDGMSKAKLELVDQITSLSQNGETDNG